MTYPFIAEYSHKVLGGRYALKYGEKWGLWRVREPTYSGKVWAAARGTTDPTSPQQIQE